MRRTASNATLVDAFGDRVLAGVVARQVDEVDHGAVAREGRVLELAGVHADGVAGARLHAVATEDAAQQVDRVDPRVFLDVRIGVLGRDDLDAPRGTRRRTQHARGATDL